MSVNNYCAKCKKEKTKSEDCLHSQPHYGRPNILTSCSRVHSMCNTANSVHTNMYIVKHLGIPFEQATMLHISLQQSLT